MSRTRTLLGTILAHGGRVAFVAAILAFGEAVLSPLHADTYQFIISGDPVAAAAASASFAPQGCDSPSNGSKASIEKPARGKRIALAEAARVPLPRQGSPRMGVPAVEAPPLPINTKGS